MLFPVAVVSLALVAFDVLWKKRKRQVSFGAALLVFSYAASFPLDVPDWVKLIPSLALANVWMLVFFTESYLRDKPRPNPKVFWPLAGCMTAMTAYIVLLSVQNDRLSVILNADEAKLEWGRGRTDSLARGMARVRQFGDPILPSFKITDDNESITINEDNWRSSNGDIVDRVELARRAAAWTGRPMEVNMNR